MNDAALAALQASVGMTPSAGNIERLGSEFGVEAARWAFSQHDLRRRGRAKFADADSMFFTPDGLEQASHEAVAAYHASRFPPGVPVADLTAGIGSDLRALAARGTAIGYETDDATRWCAERNAPTATLRGEDCMSAKWDFEFAFADPSRRDGVKRTLDPRSFQPDPLVLGERMRRLRFSGMKLSPMLADSYLEGFGAEVEFVSFGGECREAALWFGEGEGVSCRKVETDEALRRSEAPTPVAETPAAYVLAADPAAIRAHCLPTLCSSYKAATLGDSNGYLTAGEPAESVWFTTLRVLASGSHDLKRLRSDLRNADAGFVEVMSRAPGVDVAALRRNLQMSGQRHLVVVLYPVRKSVRYAVVERIS